MRNETPRQQRRPVSLEAILADANTLTAEDWAIIQRFAWQIADDITDARIMAARTRVSRARLEWQTAPCAHDFSKSDTCPYCGSVPGYDVHEVPPDFFARLHFLNTWHEITGHYPDINPR